MTNSAMYTAGPWSMQPYNETGGYDCMTGGIDITADNPTAQTPIVASLDGSHYGQKSCEPISVEGLTRLTADACLIAAAPEMYELLRTILNDGQSVMLATLHDKVQQLLARIDGTEGR